VSPETATAGGAPGGAAGPPAAPASGTKPLLRGWIHLVAVLVTVVLGPLVVSNAPSGGDRAALVVYVVALVLLFGVSAAFHRVTWSPAARRRMRRADHSTIFVAIAGTYTAVAALSLKGAAQVVVLALVWGGAAIGIALRQFWLDAPKWAVALPYVVVGWSALAVIPQLVRGMSGPGFAVLLGGGLAYTAGAIVYALRRPDPVPHVFGYHEVFHLCTVIGAGMQLAAIAFFALPRAG
jgi:hemolysin III